VDNSGNTPTRELRVYVAYEHRDTELPKDFLFLRESVPQRPASISPKGVIESLYYDIYGDDLLSVSEGEKYFYVWGVATYRDVFPQTKERITKFCNVITGISGDPLIGYNQNTNPLDIIFTIYHKHNCADEDCDEEQ
jgi:hypothetical protein